MRDFSNRLRDNSAGNSANKLSGGIIESAIEL
jgi:hypothetical protein